MMGVEVEVGLLICSNTTGGCEELSGLVYNVIFSIASPSCDTQLSLAQLASTKAADNTVYEMFPH
jgi:hypothetical protein